MKKVQYSGQLIESFSRFGRVKSGDILEMYEWEADGVASMPNFRVVDPSPSEEELEIASRVKPVDCGGIDLSSIDWSDPKLFAKMTSRMSKGYLVKLFRAINTIGGHIKESSVYDPREVLVDRIIEASRYMGWDKLSSEQRAIFGGRYRGEAPSSQAQLPLTTVAPVPQKPKIARHRERKRVQG